MYGKLINGRMVYAPQSVQVNGNTVFNPSDELIRKAGYKPVVKTQVPEASGDLVFVPSWVENEESITQVWNIQGITRLSFDEILRIDMCQRVNSLTIDNQTAGRMIDYFPTMKEVCAEGALIPAKTRIRDDHDESVIWRSNVDVWNTEANSPANAPTLWDRISYHEGIRIIPETITATQAFALDELGWWQEHIYRSTIAANVYTPDQYAAGWELLT